MTLDAIYEDMRRDKGFRHLKPSRLVPGEGSETSSIAFIVGEAPGAKEDLILRPFVGDAGEILRQLMDSAGLHSYFSEGSQYRPNCWLTNVLKYRPPANRTPTWDEIQVCRPYLRREWHAVYRPRLIIPVGGVAFTAVMGVQLSILKYAGQGIIKQSRTGPRWRTELAVWPMIHPAYALRNKAAQPTVEAHWAKLGEWLDHNQGQITGRQDQLSLRGRRA